MTITAAISVNNILTRVAVECGLEAVTDPYGSPLQHYVQLRYLLQTAGEELCLAHAWEFLVNELDITVANGDDNEYDFPADFQSMIDQSGWNRSTEEPVIGPLTAQEWQAVIGTENQNLIRYAFRIFNGKLNFFPDPPLEGTNLNFQYQSRAFVQDATDPDLRKVTFDSGADIILFDRTLITRLLKLLWLQAKGFDTTAAQAAVDQNFNFLTGKDTGGRVLDAGGGRQSIHYLDGTNLPISGFGQ
jgi:hypothetical protein